MKFFNPMLGRNAIKALITCAAINTVFVDAQGVPTKRLPNMDSASTNRIVIQYKKNESASFSMKSNAQSSLQGLGVSQYKVIRAAKNRSIVTFNKRNAGMSIEKIAEALAKNPNVDFAEPDFIAYPTYVVPNDSKYSSQWYLTDASGINPGRLWKHVTGESTVIAVVDTGITNHSDLNANILPGYDFIRGDNVDGNTRFYRANDGDGRDDDPSDPGDWLTWDEVRGRVSEGFFEDENRVAKNSSWHGTHVAGIAAAVGNNSRGIAGISAGSSILPVRVLGKAGGYGSDIADGIRWAAGIEVEGVPLNENPADVINLSLGGLRDEGSTCPRIYQDAIDEAIAEGAVVVAAAGNDGEDAARHFPSACNGVISVAATNKSQNRASFSNFGDAVTIAAPGEYIYSTLNKGTRGPTSETYVNKQGTSMAAPMVAAAAALLKSYDPLLTVEEVSQRLQDSARPFPSGSSCAGGNCGSGILNISAAAYALIREDNCSNIDTRNYVNYSGTGSNNWTSMSKSACEFYTYKNYYHYPSSGGYGYRVSTLDMTIWDRETEKLDSSTYYPYGYTGPNWVPDSTRYSIGSQTMGTKRYKISVDVLSETPTHKCVSGC